MTAACSVCAFARRSDHRSFAGRDPAFGYVPAMGTWDAGPFDNDGAADLLGAARPAAAIAETLRRCAEAAPGDYLDVDDGQPAIAACELVALGFGYGHLDEAPKDVRAIVGTLGANEELRQLAIRALPRIRDRKSSELASLWAHDPSFDAKLADLLARLIEAGD